MVKFTSLHFSFPKAHLFLWMWLVNSSKSSAGNSYALTGICILTGYIYSIIIKSKSSTDIVRTYIDHVYAKVRESLRILLYNGTEFKNELLTTIAKNVGVEYSQYNGRIKGFYALLKA